MIVENQMGVKVHMTEGGYTNIKITPPEDLAVAEAILTQYKKWKIIVKKVLTSVESHDKLIKLSLKTPTKHKIQK